MPKKIWKMWVVFDETGRPWLSTIARSRADSIRLWRMQIQKTTWDYWRKAGYRCGPVTMRREGA